jgi:hypothetical protein
MRTLKKFVFLLSCLAAGVQVYADGTINIAGPANGNGWTFAGNVVTITDNGNYSVTGTSTINRIVIDKDVTATVTLRNASIHSAAGSPFMLSSDDTGGSDVTLILVGNNELISTDTLSAGLMVTDNARLTIAGGDSLTATGAYYGAGIGGGISGSGGNITVTGGTITANGGEQAAGIGGGYNGSGGNITINNGVVIATTPEGEYRPAGIGGGGGDTNAGTITIAGGTVYASSVSGVGIGHGNNGAAGVIHIIGGTVIANEVGASATHISGSTTIVLSPSITATDFGGAKVLTGDSVDVSNAITTGDTIADVTLKAAFTIPAGSTLTVPAGIVFDVNHKVLTNNGAIRNFGSIINMENLGGNPLNAIMESWIDSIPAHLYTGDSIKPAVAVRDGDSTLIPGADYTVRYSNNVNAGTATVTVTGAGKYTGTASINFTINPKPVADDWIADIPEQIYQGDSVKPAVAVKDGDNTLVSGTDYTVGYSNNANAGTATATVTGTGNYTGTANKAFIITGESTDSVPNIVAGQDSIVLQSDSSLAGGFTLSLAMPVDAKPEDGSTITVTFPVAGFTLDTANTKVSGALSDGFELLFTRLSDVAWKLTIVNKTQGGSLRAAAALVIRDIIEVKYIIGKDVPPNDYVITAGVEMSLVDNGEVIAHITDMVSLQAEMPRTAVTGVTFPNGNYSYILKKGDALQLFAAVVPEAAGNRSVSWATSNGNVATVSGSGQVRAVAAGEATITVTTDDGNKTNTCRIQVLDEVITQDDITENIIEKDTVLYNITAIDSVIYNIVAKDSTVYNLIIRDSTDYNLITGDSVRYNITVKDSVIYNIIVSDSVIYTTIDSVIYNIVYKDSIDYTLVPERIYIATDITGAEHIVTEDARVVRVGTTLRIEGLKPGKTFGIYTIKGEKYYSGTAQSDVFRLDNIPESVYILYHDGQYSKFSY